MGSASVYRLTGPFAADRQLSNQVFLVRNKDQYLHDFLAAHRSSVRHVNDHGNLEDVIKEMRAARVALKIRSGLAFVSEIFEQVKFKIKNSAEFIIAQNANRTHCRTFSNDDVFYIKQDKITPTQFARFLEPFCDVASKYQPLILIEADHSFPKLKKSLANCPDSLNLVEYSNGQGKVTAIKSSGVSELKEFVRLYSDNCFAAIARTSMEDWNKLLPNSEVILKIAQDLLLIRAKLMHEDRFAVTPIIRQILGAVEKNEEHICNQENYDSFLFIRALLKLNLLFCTESPQGTLDHAVAVSAALDDPLLKAYALRFANFIEGNGFLKCHLLQRAEAIFEQNHIPDHALYCRNNRLVTAFRMDQILTNEFDNVADGIEELTPFLHRREDVFYNAGFNRLLQKDYEGAFKWFTRADDDSARALISASARVAKLIVRHLDGQTVAFDELDATANFLMQSVDPRNVYHVTNLKLNLLVLAKQRGFDGRHLQVKFGELALGRPTDVMDENKVNEYLARGLGLFEGFCPHQPGAKGQFAKDAGFSLPYYFIWS
jgi:hypothetical protein